MSGTTLLDYNLALVQVIIGDFRVTGWGADDACSVEKVSDDFEHDVSTDGAHGTVNRINDNRWIATFRVRRGSVGYRKLYDEYQKQLKQSDAGAVAALAVSLYDPLSGDKVAERRGRFIKQPAMGFGKTAGVAEFQMLLPNAQVDPGTKIDTQAAS